MSSPAPAPMAPEDEICQYRHRTRALLRRYFYTSIEVGRLPSLLGREFFRAKVTSYRASSFEDAVIFVHDVERCLQNLEPVSQRLIAMIVFQNYNFDEAAAILHCTWRTIANRFPSALDDLSRLFLRGSLLEEISCQETKNVKSAVTDSRRSK